MNTSSIITQALIETRQHDRLARARRIRQASAAREAAKARRTQAETSVWPLQRFRFTVRRPVFRNGV